MGGEHNHRLEQVAQMPCCLPVGRLLFGPPTAHPHCAWVPPPEPSRTLWCLFPSPHCTLLPSDILPTARLLHLRRNQTPGSVTQLPDTCWPVSA